MEPVWDGIGCLTGIAPWKRRRITSMLANRHGPPHRANPARALRKARSNGGALACWATRMPKNLPQMARDANVDLWRIEDGFIRSVGLGASLVQPCSIVVDRQGVHYDPARPSDLEDLLQNRQFNAAECQRASLLAQRLITSGVTKYNLHGDAAALPTDRRIVLVIGQVEDDQSMLLGGNGMTSADLLRRVRADKPDACLVYRPHPDVTAGLRPGLAEGAADIIAADAPITQLIEAADAVHVISSLAGFEALLRGREVVVHGAPFYAGWGLTEDRMQLPRRTRTLSLPQLLAAVLIAYPVYADPDTGRRCDVEQLVEKLAQREASDKMGPMRRIAAKAALGVGRIKWPRFQGKTQA